MMMNCNTLCRIDQLEHFDGTFSEGSSLNGVAWTGIAMPSILWTYSLAGQNDRELDAFFQQHLVMNVFPSAPWPSNDHMIQPGDPNGSIEQAYLAYGPLFTSMRGARWYLTPEPVIAQGVVVNALLAPTAQGHDLLAPLMLGEPNATVAVDLEVDAAVGALLGRETLELALLAPGQQWRSLGQVQLRDGRARVSVPLGGRGGAMLRASVRAEMLVV